MEPEHLRLRTTRYGHVYGLGAADAPEVWLVLHGYGQRADRFLRRFRDVAGPERRVVAPEGLSRFYLDDQYEKVGASWMTREDRQEEIADQLAWLDTVVAAVTEDHSRLTVLGFSQGAPTAGRWLLRGRGRAERLICWGAGLPHDVDLERARLRLEGVELVLVVGDDDPFLTPDRVSGERERLEAAGLRARWMSYRGGHDIDPAVLGTLADGPPSTGPDRQD